MGTLYLTTETKSGSNISSYRLNIFRLHLSPTRPNPKSHHHKSGTTYLLYMVRNLDGVSRDNCVEILRIDLKPSYPITLVVQDSHGSVTLTRPVDVVHLGGFLLCQNQCHRTSQDPRSTDDGQRPFINNDGNTYARSCTAMRMASGCCESDQHLGHLGGKSAVVVEGNALCHIMLGA